MFVALAKLSLSGGGAATLNVKGCDFPPPGGVLRTEMSSVLPNGPRRAAGSVAVKQVGSGQEDVGAATVIPFCAPLKSTFAPLAKPVPVNWMDILMVGLGVCTGVLGGLIAVRVGTAASTANVRELLVAVPTWTVTLAVPATRREGAMVADRVVSVPPASMVTPVADPFHWMLPPVRPVPFTVSVNCGPPWVAALRVREGSCSRKEWTTTRGSPVLRVLQVQDVTVQLPTKTPRSVAA